MIVTMIGGLNINGNEVGLCGSATRKRCPVLTFFADYETVSRRMNNNY